jgi:ribosomal protein S18 acetylase RimI-like enzyme
MIEIKSLQNLGPGKLFKAFTLAFADYEALELDQVGLMKMLKRRGFRADLSFGAFVNGQLQSFTFNGFGRYNGLQTAYDTGTGTVKAYRGQGLAKKIFLESLSYLKAAGTEQYLLEVLQHNHKAVGLYQGLGFEHSREFSYFVTENKDLKIPDKKCRLDIRLKKIPALLPDEMKAFWDFEPSWQNSFAALNREISDFEIVGAYQVDISVILTPQIGHIDPPWVLDSMNAMV